MMKENTSYYVILGILSFGECSGYDIKRKIEHGIGYFYKVSNGQIYPVLKKLVLHNNATCVTEKNDGKPDRKVYSITDQGLAVLKEWLQADTGSELLIKLFFGSNLPIAQNLHLISDIRKKKESALNTYNNIASYFNLSTINEVRDYYNYFTLRFGQLISKTYIDWCDEVSGILHLLDKAGGTDHNMS
jgi:DNA-binding PadR family transcriptional regulator